MSSHLEPLSSRSLCYYKIRRCKTRVYLEVETVEELTDEYERGEKDLQSIYICSMSLTQVNSSLQHRRNHIRTFLDLLKVLRTWW